MSVQSAEFELNVKWGRRPVYVVNSYHEEYREVFRGKEIVIPPNGERKVKMPYLMARRFLGQPVAIPETLPNGSIKGSPKSLQTIELSHDELEREGFVPKKGKSANELLCPLCGFEGKTAQGLSVHIAKQHADAQRAPSE